MSAFQIIPITTTGSQLVTTGDQETVSTAVVQVSGLVGAMTPQLHVALSGTNAAPPTAVDCLFTNVATGVTSPAGDAIIADGIYEFQTDGCALLMDVTSLTGTCDLYVWTLQGVSGVAGSSGGAVTVADGADVALGATDDSVETDPTQDATAIALLKGLLQALTIPGSAMYGQVALNSSTATQIVAANTTRRGLVISNPDDTNAIYLGGSGVTSSTGFYLAPLAQVSLGLVSGAIYGVSSGGTPSATYCEV